MTKNKGAVLTGVILMVLVMTLIGVPLLSMVIYNYRLVELSNSLKRSEYENEMAMDIISVIIRETVIDAISHSKNRASIGINELVELQRSNYSSVYGKYNVEWINAYNSWESGAYDENSGILDGFLDSIDGINWSSYADKELKKETARKNYVEMKVEQELARLNTSTIIEEEEGPEPVLTSEENDDILGLLNFENGNINEEKLHEAYNTIFTARYQSYIKNILPGAILKAERYIDVVNELNNIDVSGNDELVWMNSGVIPDNYLKIMSPVIKDADLMSNENDITVDVGTMFKKNKTTPPTRLSATFVIKTPSFDSVATVNQENISLSNALLNQGGVVVGGKLTLKDGNTLKIFNDLTVMGQGTDTAVLLESGTKLLAGNYIGTDFEASNSRISIAKDIVLRDKNTFYTGKNPIYYRNLYIGDSESSSSVDNVMDVYFYGDAVAEDDLEISYEGKVNINQTETANYYGFNDTNNKGPDSSSSIVFNSQELSNKTVRLGNLYLAGRAFIEGVLGTDNIPIKDEFGNDVLDAGGNIIYADTTYKTGESIAIKGNYIAYQYPLFDDNPDYEFLSNKLEFLEYGVVNKNDDGRKNVYIKLVGGFKIKPSDYLGNFDVNYKWRYFKEYADQYGDILKKVKVDSNSVRYVEGTAFDRLGNVIDSTNSTISDMSFRNNLADEYEKYTKYFGYRPVKEDGTVDTSKVKTAIFGSNGWIKPFSGTEEKNTPIDNGNYYIVYTDGDESITLSGTGNKGVIICKGNLTIDVPSNATFSGVIIVGGNLTIKRGTLTLTDSKEEVINTIIGNYLGNNSGENGVTKEQGDLFDKFAYDGSGSTYIVTEIGDSIININDLIGITNWKKSNYGRL